MPGSLFAAAAVQATAAVDAFMGEDFAVQPMAIGADVNAPAAVDPARPAFTVRATLVDPEAKPAMPNSYDPRQVRRPGVESGSPKILITPSAMASVPAGFTFARPDRLTQLSTGAVFTISAPFAMAGGTQKLHVNLID